MTAPAGLAPPVTTPTERRLPGLDGLRAIAIIAVVVYHLHPEWLPGGFLGVDLFFVISGLLITSLLLRRLRAGRPGIGSFYGRRARRILPATVLVVGVLVPVAATTRGLVHLESGDVLAGLGFATNWWQIVQGRDYFAALAAPSSLQHLWSLAIEEQFYLLWPTVLALLGLLARRTARRTESLVAWVAFAGALASSGWMFSLAVTQDIPDATGASRVYYGTDTHAQGLLVGAGVAALLALRRSPAGPRPRWWVRLPVELLGLAAVAAVGYATVRLGEADPLLYRGGFLAVALVAVVAVTCVSRPWSVLGRALDVPPVRWIGLVSFELYLWHWPVGLAAKTAPWTGSLWWDAAQVALMIALAGVTHHYVTVPIWHPSPRATTTTTDPATLRPPPLLGVAALAALAATVVAFVAAIPAALGGPSSPSLASLTVTAPPPPPPPPPTALGLPALAEPISAFGDSVMLGATTTMHKGMPQITVRAQISMPPATIYGWVREAKAGGTLAPIVVIHAGANGMIKDDGLNKLLNELGDRTVVVLVTIRLGGGTAWYRQLEPAVNQAIYAAAAGHPNSVVADWAEQSEGHPEYFISDGIHLTGKGAAAFTQMIETAIAEYTPPAS